MMFLAKWTIVLFGIYIICAGFLMLFAPEKARATLRMAGSTNLINYGEITYGEITLRQRLFGVV